VRVFERWRKYVCSRVWDEQQRKMTCETVKTR
jgi:hypothetical protein